MKKLIVFDLDGTLAESKSPIDAEMSELLHDLLGTVKVAVISGGDWPQFERPDWQLDAAGLRSKRSKMSESPHYRFASARYRTKVRQSGMTLIDQGIRERHPFSFQWVTRCLITSDRLSGTIRRRAERHEVRAARLVGWLVLHNGSGLDRQNKMGSRSPA